MAERDAKDAVAGASVASDSCQYETCFPEQPIGDVAGKSGFCLSCGVPWFLLASRSLKVDVLSFETQPHLIGAREPASWSRCVMCDAWSCDV